MEYLLLVPYLPDLLEDRLFLSLGLYLLLFLLRGT